MLLALIKPANHSADPISHTGTQIVRRLPENVIELSRVKMNVTNHVLPNGPYNWDAKPPCETGFEVDTPAGDGYRLSIGVNYTASKISYNKSRTPYFRNYFIINFVAMLFLSMRTG